MDVEHFFLEDILGFKLLQNQRVHKGQNHDHMAHLQFVSTTRENDHIREGTQTRKYVHVLQRVGCISMTFQNILSSVGSTSKNRPVQYSCAAVEGCPEYVK